MWMVKSVPSFWRTLHVLLIDVDVKRLAMSEGHLHELRLGLCLAESW